MVEVQIDINVLRYNTTTSLLNYIYTTDPSQFKNKSYNENRITKFILVFLVDDIQYNANKSYKL